VGRARWPGGARAVGAADRLPPGHRVGRDTRAGPVVARHDRAGRGRHRRDLPGPEAVDDRLLGEVLAAYPELVHLLAGDVVHLSEVLRGLPHGEVDVWQRAVFTRIGPGLGVALGALFRPGVGVGELRVLPTAADQRLN